ncbi:MAG: hypothetical protein PUC39_09615 [Lachnospiraceae bacterium]|nr:hypothetical protein [Lachnospiraceae bacterium]
MLGRLYKHEMKASGHYFVPIYIGVALASLLFAIVWGINMVWDNSIFSSITVPFAILLFIGIIAAIYIGTEIVNIVRFYKTMVSEEGYLTHTLPVTVNQLLLSKGFAATTYYLIAAVAMAAVVGLFIVVTLVATGAVYTTEWETAMNAFGEVMQEMKVHGFSVAAYTIEVVLAIFVGAISKLFLVYLAIAIGQCMKSHKALWSVGFYLCINIVVGLVSQVIATVVMIGFGLNSTYDVWIENHIGTYMHVTMWGGILMSLITLIVSYFLVRYIFQKKLNLE